VNRWPGRVSTAFVYPSLYEGFGIPPLEAMACGACVIASAASSIPEVVGGAAVMVDPISVDSLVSAMADVLNMNGDRRAEWVRKGMARAKCFDWAKTAQQTADIYRQLAPCG
jgi:glycosyltransferase involved in cell wall biosynthesis